MKHLQWLLATACMLAVCLSVSAQSGKKVKSISPEKWVKSKVWSEGLKAKPHSSTNLAEFKAQYEANPEQWKAAFRWLASHDLTTIEKRTSESHRKHIDLQYVVKGTERFALLDHESSKANCEYSEKKDVIHYDFDPEKTTFIDSVPGEFFLFFPSDWHIAKIATDKEDQDIRVIVIKLDYM